MGLIDQFKEELASIKRAPLTFFVGFVALACLIYWVEYSFLFKESISRKDSLIETLERELSVAKSQLQTKPTASQPVFPSTGPAIANGAEGVANSGTIGTLTQDKQKSTGGKMKR